MVHAGNLFLVGMMGAGKTTVGRLLARRMKRAFLDSDHEVERRCGVPVPVIFEAQMIAELTARDGVVLASGGGTVLDPENRRWLAARGTVVYLHASPADLYERVRHDRNRPLLATSDPLAKLESLYAERDPLYREVADLIVDTGMQSAQTLARHLLGRLEENWKLSV